MNKKFFIINLALAVIVVLLAMRVYEEWVNPQPSGTSSLASSKPKTAPLQTAASAPLKKEGVPPNQFKTISEKNLFSPERKEFPISLSPDMRKPPARPNVTLYGVVLGEELTSAIISNPTRRAEKGERETMTVREGDRVGEYKVAKILQDRISLEMEGDSFDVLLYDPSKPKKRPVVATPERPTPTTPTPPGATPPAVTQPPRPFTPPATITQPPAVPAPSTPVRPLPRRSVTPERSEQRRTAPVAPPAPRRPSPPVEEDEEDEED